MSFSKPYSPSLTKRIMLPNHPSNAIIMGIDPGFDRVGWAVGQCNPRRQVTPLAFGLIQTQKTDDIFVRYQQIQQELAAILEKHHPESVGLETLFFSKNTKTALRVSEARGIIIAQLLQHGCRVHEYNPVQVKQAVTGFGQADKAAVEKMVRLQLRIAQTKVMDDTMDALALLLTHSTQQ